MRAATIRDVLHTGILSAVAALSISVHHRITVWKSSQLPLTNVTCVKIFRPHRRKDTDPAAKHFPPSSSPPLPPLFFYLWDLGHWPGQAGCRDGRTLRDRAVTTATWVRNTSHRERKRREIENIQHCGSWHSSCQTQGFAINAPPQAAAFKVNALISKSY